MFDLTYRTELITMPYFMFKVESDGTKETLCAECADLLLEDPNVQAQIVRKWQVQETDYADDCESCTYNEKPVGDYVPKAGTTDRPRRVIR